MIVHEGISNLVIQKEERLFKINKLLAISADIVRHLSPSLPDIPGLVAEEDAANIDHAQVVKECEKLDISVRDLESQIRSIDEQASALTQLPDSLDDLKKMHIQSLDKQRSLEDQLRELQEKHKALNDEQRQVAEKLKALRETRNTVKVAVQTKAVSKALRKRQIQKARWTLFVSVLGYVAYRVLVLGGFV